jgi:hypothetical protein
LKKICKGCGRNRKIGKFGKDSSKADGKRIYCRDCISIINKTYRTSPVGKIKHKKCVETWKKRNKAAIREYNKAYYLKKRHIILYNKKAKKETESILILDKLDKMPFYLPKTCNMKIIRINPKERYNLN